MYSLRTGIVLFLFLAAALAPGCGCDPQGGRDAGPTPDPDGGIITGDGGPLADGGGPDAGGQGPIDPICEANVNDPNGANVDCDCDGISNAEEFTSTYAGGERTDPNNYDSDGDGLADGIEAGRTAIIDDN